MRIDIAGLALLGLIACAKSSSPGDETAAAAGSVSASSALQGPRWRLVELEGQPSLSGGGAREPHLIFSRDSVDRVGGATGCNTMGGRYTAEGDRIRFSDLFSTKMACVEEERMRQETRFVGALGRVDRYAISGDTLTLSEGGTVVAKFVKG
ncbi:MAG TPA: META domain-containing protein [Gemmatimonadaceae bacterium]|nr:META domain-containing protein [Gemmatimonadaceae bacterium]